MPTNKERETVYIPFNGIRRYIDANRHIIEALKAEGWTIGEPHVYFQSEDGKPSEFDYMTILIYRNF